MRTVNIPGVGDTDHMQECMARIDNPKAIQIDGWFTMETAPLDGTTIMVRDGKWEPCRARFDAIGGAQGTGCWRFVEHTSFVPTLWQPCDEAASKATGQAQ